MLIGEALARFERARHMSDTELLPKSKVEREPPRRVEVFTGAGRRRAWSAEQKQQIVAESFESGETVSAVARRYGLTPQQLFGWRRSARRPPKTGGATFAPVIVDGALPITSGHPMVEIVVGAASVRVSPGVDAATLTTVLRALRSIP
jgi:transposase